MALTERLAKREFEVVRRYQKSPYLPSLVDSWQALPNYSGEICFFSLADSGARSIAEARADASWTEPERRAFTLSALQALAELGCPEDADEVPFIHRPALCIEGPANARDRIHSLQLPLHPLPKSEWSDKT